MAQQFAVGVLIVVRENDPGERDKIFIAANTRTTVGRGSACDVNLPEIALSRRDFVISADGRPAYTPKILVPSMARYRSTVTGCRDRIALASGDVIRVGSTEFEFQPLTPNL